MSDYLVTLKGKDDVVQAVISDALQGSDFQQKIENYQGEPLSVDLAQFASPVRLGVVLDYIAGLLRAPKQRFYAIGSSSYTLDTQNHVLECEESEPIRLTEKEAALLVVLAQAEGRAVERQAVLKAVWDYAESVETHTLETHIYRLRQKIEVDPAAPAILVTDGDGYRLV